MRPNAKIIKIKNKIKKASIVSIFIRIVNTIVTIVVAREGPGPPNQNTTNNKKNYDNIA